MLFFADVYDKTLTSIFLTMLEDNQNIVRMMHIRDTFQTISKYRKGSHIFFKCEIGLTFKTLITYFRYVKANQGYTFD